MLNVVSHMSETQSLNFGNNITNLLLLLMGDLKQFCICFNKTYIYMSIWSEWEQPIPTWTWKCKWNLQNIL